LLKKYWDRYWKLFCLSIVCVGLEALASLLLPTIVSRIVDVGLVNNDLNYIVRSAGLMLAITVAGALMASSRNVIASIVSQKFGRDLRLDLYAKIQYLSVTSIDKMSRASLITRLTNDVTQIQNFANGLMRVFIKAPIVCIGCLVMSVILSLELSIPLMVILPIIGVLIYLNIKIGYPLFKKVQLAIDNINAIMREHLSGIRVVKAFNRQDYEEKRFAVKNEGLYGSSVTAMRMMAVFTPAIAFVVNIGIVAVLWRGGSMVGGGTLEVGKIIAFVNYLTQLIIYLNIITNVFNQLIRAFTSYERIKEVMDAGGEEAPAAAREEISPAAPKLEFKDVTFYYNSSGELPALRKISFRCGRGETVGVIGATGAGKTTLLNLILRFYRIDGGGPNEGAIYIDGIETGSMPAETLRGKIAWVPQESGLFTGTIKDNIRWGRKDATDGDVIRAAEAACAHEFISSFADGYDTMLGRGGVNLSGGQKQRVSIARALIKQPEILLLDDSTSSVDFTTERKIRENLKSLAGSLTCIVIAQRISQVRYADKIVVMDKGMISAVGSHDELIASSDVYREIYESQIDSL